MGWFSGSTAAIVDASADFRGVFAKLKPGAYMAVYNCQHRDIASIEDSGFEIRDVLLWLRTTGNIMVCLARVPVSKTTIDNVIEHGVGGLNIEACRVPTTKADVDLIGKPLRRGVRVAEHIDYRMNGNAEQTGVLLPPAGRFPANLLHDGSVDDGFPESNSTRIGNPNEPISGSKHMMTSFKPGDDSTFADCRDSGRACRFFYKAQDEAEIIEYLKRLLEQPE